MDYFARVSPLNLAFSGIFVLMDLYRSGQSITNYLLYGAFISAFISLGKRENQRNLRSKTYLHPDN